MRSASAVCTVTKSYYSIGKEHTCPVCGKKFLIPYSPRLGGGAKWIYQYREGNKKKYACTYSCYRVVEKMKEEQKRNDRKNA